MDYNGNINEALQVSGAYPEMRDLEVLMGLRAV